MHYSAQERSRRTTILFCCPRCLCSLGGGCRHCVLDGELVRHDSFESLCVTNQAGFTNSLSSSVVSRRTTLIEYALTHAVCVLTQEEGERAGYLDGLSISAVCRVWTLANEHALVAKKVLMRGSSHVMSAKKGRNGGVRLRAVRTSSDQKTVKFCQQGFRLQAAELVKKRLPPEILTALIGHPGL